MGGRPSVPFNPQKSPVSGGDLPLNVIGEVCRGGGADHERHHSQADPQPVWSCSAVGIRGCLMREMPESNSALQLLLLSGGHLEFVVDQGVDHALTLGLPVLGAIVWTT